MADRILIVEDEAKLAALLRDYLAQEDFEVTVMLPGADLALTAVEFQPGRIYARDQLMDAMYRDERVVADRTVDSHIKKIRRKIATVRPDREILPSVYGVGYKCEW